MDKNKKVVIGVLALIAAVLLVIVLFNIAYTPTKESSAIGRISIYVRETPEAQQAQAMVGEAVLKKGGISGG